MSIRTFSALASSSSGVPAPGRQRDIRHALRALAPLIPLDEATDVIDRAARASMTALTPMVATWLALTSHIRHRHTDYDDLLSDGYDRDAARFFVVDATDEKLTEWGCSRRVREEADSSP